MNRTMIILLLGITFSMVIAPTTRAGEGNDFFSGFGRSFEELKGRFTGSSEDKSNPQDDTDTVKGQQETGPEQPQKAATNDPADIKTQIRDIQTLLSTRGFDAGVADGIPGKKTRDAICHYQSVHGLDINPRPSQALLSHLQQAKAAAKKGRYTGILQHQCEIAHINNLNNIEAVEFHSYEGTLTPDDLMCKDVVSPFGVDSNIEVLFSSFTDNLFNILSGKDSELKLQELREKAKKANWMPLAMEINYGEQIHNSRMGKTGKILSRESKRQDVKSLYQKGDAVLERLLSAIGEEFPYHFKLFIVDDRSVNAEAIPGGFLYVNSGVFSTDYADLVIAHEIAHVLRRHTTKELQARLVDTADTAEDLKKLINNDADNAEAILEEVLLLHGAIAQYSKQQELQSDACAVRIAMRAQLPQLSRHIDGYISDIEKDQMEISKKASSHPAYPERKTRMITVYEEAEEG